MPHTQTVPIDRSLIIELAREMLGTPFVHQGRVPGVGVDCGGVLECVWNKLPCYPRVSVTSYGRVPHQRAMTAVLDKYFERIAIGAAGLGDVIHIAWVRNIPQHVGILTDIGIVHAYAYAKRVVEEPLEQAWRGKVRAAYRFPGVS